MNEQQFKDRTKQLALRVIRMVEALPAAANCRAACISRSNAAMIAKLDIVLEEADETLFWEELLVDSGLVSEARMTELLAETREITATTVASLKTLRARSRLTSKTRQM